VKTQADLYKGLGGYGTLGLEIVISFLLGLFGGRWLDDRYGTSPWLFFAGTGLGAVLSIKAILRTTKLMRRVAEREEREQGNPKPLYESSSEREARARREGDFAGGPVILEPFEGATPSDEDAESHDERREPPSAEERT
jgi:F0F1-type ATP synthase assembly protein I